MAHRARASLVWAVELLFLSCFAAGSRNVLQDASSGAQQALLDLTVPLRNAGVAAIAPAPAPLELADSPNARQPGQGRRLLSSSSGELQMYLATDGCNFQAACYGWVTWSISGGVFQTGVSSRTPA